MTLQKKDFIEIEFTGRIKDGNIFDSNVGEDLKKINPDSKTEPRPLVFSLGEDMFLKGVDDFLIGKPVPEKPTEYEIELSPEKAFGKRDAKLIERMPLRIFKEHNLQPAPGFAFNFDGRIGKVLAASGGRVIVDFNNPVAGKDVVYKVKVLRKVNDINEKAKAMIDFLFRRNLEFEIKDKKLIIFAEKQMLKFIELFKDKFKEILSLDLEVKEKAEEKPEMKSVEKSEGKK
jgi:FKBP-type peptidyl-prolyl cis-trans isomerase 2